MRLRNTPFATSGKTTKQDAGFVRLDERVGVRRRPFHPFATYQCTESWRGSVCCTIGNHCWIAAPVRTIVSGQELKRKGSSPDQPHGPSGLVGTFVRRAAHWSNEGSSIRFGTTSSE